MGGGGETCPPPEATGLPGGHSEWEPPDPFSNSEVKTLCADVSVDFVDVKVGHCQALNLMKTKPSPTKVGEGFFMRSGGITAQTYKTYSSSVRGAATDPHRRSFAHLY